MLTKIKRQRSNTKASSRRCSTVCSLSVWSAAVASRVLNQVQLQEQLNQLLVMSPRVAYTSPTSPLWLHLVFTSFQKERSSDKADNGKRRAKCAAFLRCEESF